MRRGFRFEETMSGTFALADTPEDRRPFSFRIEARADSILGYLRTGRTAIHGTLEADGFADGVPIDGRLTFLPLTKRSIRYQFNLTADDGNPYRFDGRQRIRLLSLLGSFTTLPGAICDSSGKKVADCDARFHVRRDLRKFLASWRPV